MLCYRSPRKAKEKPTCTWSGKGLQDKQKQNLSNRNCEG